MGLSKVNSHCHYDVKVNLMVIEYYLVYTVYYNAHAYTSRSSEQLCHREALTDRCPISTVNEPFLSFSHIAYM